MRTWGAICYFTCSRHLIRSRAVTNCLFFLSKDLFFFMSAQHALSYHLIEVPWSTPSRFYPKRHEYWDCCGLNWKFWVNRDILKNRRQYHLIMNVLCRYITMWLSNHIADFVVCIMLLVYFKLLESSFKTY